MRSRHERACSIARAAPCVRRMATSATASQKRPAGDLGDASEHAAPLEPAPRTTLCDVVQLVAMNGFGAAVERCVCVCRNMRTNVELWERVVDLPHRDDVDYVYRMTCLFVDDDYLTTRLIHWARVGDLARVRETLGRGADFNVRDIEGHTALFRASECGHLAVVRELLDRGADVEARSGTGLTALLGATRRGRTAVVVALAARGADVNARDDIGLTPLMWACMGRSAIVTELLRLGADVYARNNVGSSALLFAASSGHTDAVRTLLAAPGIDVNLANAEGATALSCAREEGHAAIVALLEAAGAR